MLGSFFVRTVDPTVARLYSLKNITNYLLRKLERRWRKNIACINGLKDYEKKNWLIKLRYYFLNKKKEENEEILEIDNTKLKGILEEIENLITKVSKEI